MFLRMDASLQGADSTLEEFYGAKMRRESGAEGGI